MPLSSFSIRSLNFNRYKLNICKASSVSDPPTETLTSSPQGMLEAKRPSDRTGGIISKRLTP